jgi:ribosome-binding factor A
MKKNFSRIQRINQQVMQELAGILHRDMKDPRLGMVTVTSVEVSKDLSFAKVYVTFFTQEGIETTDQLKILNTASAYIRTLVASRVKLRVTPELRFVHDASLEQGMRMSALTSAAVMQDEEKNQRFNLGETE